MTSTRHEKEGDRLSPQGLENVLRLLVVGQNKRVSSAVVDGRTIWIKRMGAQGAPLFKKLHALVSPLIPWPILRSSKVVGPEQMTAREARKNAAFAAAGFPSVTILLHRGKDLVLAHAETLVQDELDRLKNIDSNAHDELLVACAAALGKVHSAGLCYGRPHPRDMILEGGRIGFIDFEEAPEESVPLADAQARDVWLLFLQICGQSLKQDTPQRAFAAYVAEAPADVIPQLAASRGVFRAMCSVLRLLVPFGLGSDGRRLLKAGDFLYPALADAQSNKSNHTSPQSFSGRKPKATQ